MEPRRYIDAEEALAELDRRPVVLRGLHGRDWELYASMPAKPVFRLMLLRAERGEDELAYGELLSLMSEMVPAEVFQAWLDGGLTMAEALVLLNRVLAAYNGDGEKAGAEGEARAPRRRTSAASNTGSR